MSATPIQQEPDDLLSIEIRLLDTLCEMGPQSIERLVSLSGLNLAQVSQVIDRLSRSRTVSLLQTDCGEYQVSMTEIPCWI
jgi:predicted transcriptional regulator